VTPLSHNALGPAGSALGWTVLCALLPGIVLVAWTALVLSWLGPRRPAWRYRLALASWLLVLLLPALQFAMLSRIAPADNPVQEPTIRLFVHKLESGPTPLREMRLPARVLFGLQAGAGPLLPWIVLGWGIGASVLGVRLAGGWLFLRRRLRGQTRPAPAHLQVLLDGLRERMGVRRPVRLLISDRPGVPSTLGWRNPAILLPADFPPRLANAHLESILLHELAHVRRQDYAVNGVQVFAEALFFWNPAVWLASRRLRMERESCCDAEAVRAGGDVLRYALALACVERLREPAGGFAVALCGSSLVVRLRQLLELQARGTQTVNLWAAAGLFFLVLLGCGAAGAGSVWIAAKQRVAAQEFEGWRAVSTTHKLMATLQGRTPSLEPEMAEVFRSARDSRWLMALLAALRSPDSETREEAAWALGLLGDPRAGPYLEPMQNDPNPAVRVAVTEALTRLR
jgi:beta-lactamase regulating signal transducer with metallopeptidase domain